MRVLSQISILGANSAPWRPWGEGIDQKTKERTAMQQQTWLTRGGRVLRSMDIVEATRKHRAASLFVRALAILMFAAGSFATAPAQASCSGGRAEIAAQIGDIFFAPDVESSTNIIYLYFIYPGT